MSRQGQKWTAIEIFQLYGLISNGDNTPTEIAQVLERSVKALEVKVKNGGLYDEDLIPLKPFPSFFSFYRTLKRKRQVVPPDINFSYKSGKLRKIFFKWARNVEGLHSIPENKQYLVPKINKWDAKTKCNAGYKWYYFAERAQANPFMQSYIYKRDGGLCVLCANQLTEADYQGHHSDYEHKCTFKGRGVTILGKKTPNCESCFKQNEARFKGCASRLHAVHGLCNKKLSE